MQFFVSFREMTLEDLKLREKLPKGHDKTFQKVRTNCSQGNPCIKAVVIQNILKTLLSKLV